VILQPEPSICLFVSLFYHHFIKTGLFSKIRHHDLHKAYDLRQKGDYFSKLVILEEEAEMLIKEAESFIKEIVNYLRKESFL